jgi:hypothetical protein
MGVGGGRWEVDGGWMYKRGTVYAWTDGEGEGEGEG